MNKKQNVILVLFVSLVVIVAILYGIYTFFTTNGFAPDGSIQDGKKELIKIIRNVDDPKERKRQINDALEFNIITPKEANELY